MASYIEKIVKKVLIPPPWPRSRYSPDVCVSHLPNAHLDFMPNMSKTLHGESDDDKALALLAPASRRATSKSTNVSLFDAGAVCAILACRASSWSALCRPSSAWRCVDISHSIPTHAARRLSLSLSYIYGQRPL
jgi:hypothetical protein